MILSLGKSEIDSESDFVDSEDGDLEKDENLEYCYSLKELHLDHMGFTYKSKA